MLTSTWRRRINTTGSRLRTAGLTIALTSCTVVAISTIWGWLFNHPIDVAGPARTAVNRTDLVGSYAQDCVTRWLTATSSDQQSLQSCFSVRDPMRLPTNPPVVIADPAVSAVTLVSDTATVQQWSVVISVAERPYSSAAPHTAFYRLPVVYTRYGVRASALPARINGPGAGADAPLAYPAALADTSPVFATVSGFLTSYLTGAGGLERYVTATSGLVPTADYRSVTLTRLQANHNVADQTSPAEGTTVHVLATVSAVTTQYTPLTLNYPLSLVVASSRWSIAGIDYAPLLATPAEPTPVVPTPDGQR